jgi:hypothetical protein
MRPQLLGTLSACSAHGNHKNVLSDVKKGGTKAAFFVKLTTDSGAGRCIVVVASGNNDTSDNSSSCDNRDDYAATTAELAFFFRNASALHLGSNGLYRSSSLSNDRGTGQSNSSHRNERDFTETHFFGSFKNEALTHQRPSCTKRVLAQPLNPLTI